MQQPIPAAPADAIALSTRAHILTHLFAEGGHATVPELAREVGVPYQTVVAQLANMRRDGLVTYHDATNAAGIRDLTLTAKGRNKVARIRDEVIAGNIAADMLGEGVRMQPTLSPVAPRRTLDTGVVSIATGGAAARRRRQATDPHAHGSQAEGGPVTVTHEPVERPETPAEAPAAPITPEPAPAPPSGILDGLPLIAEIAGRAERRAKATEAAAMLEAAGLDDLALAAMAAIPEDDPLAREVMELLARVAP